MGTQKHEGGEVGDMGTRQDIGDMGTRRHEGGEVRNADTQEHGDNGTQEHRDTDVGTPRRRPQVPACPPGPTDAGLTSNLLYFGLFLWSLVRLRERAERQNLGDEAVGPQPHWGGVRGGG